MAPQNRTPAIRKELIMRIILAAIIIVAFVSLPVFGDLAITVPEITVFDQDLTGSFEVFISTDETHSLFAHQTQINLSPASSGITFTSAEMTAAGEHPYVFPGATGMFGWELDNGGTTITVADDIFAGPGPAPSLVNGAGLFKVNFDIAPGTPASVFDVTINTNPDVTGLIDGGFQPLTHTVTNGNIRVEQLQAGSHRLRVDFRERDAGGDGNWGNGRSLLLTYGESGATSGRTDPGINGDASTGWGNEKFKATEIRDYGVYTIGTLFGSGDDMLVRDARELGDTSNVLIETYTNKVFEYPGAWVEGVTWNEGGTLEFTVESADKDYFDGFQIVQKEPGRFLVLEPEHTGVDTTLGVFLDANGEGSLDFDRIGCDWFGGMEVDWWVGPFAGFDLIPSGGAPWSDPDAPIVADMGTIAIMHPHTPEPSSLILLTIVGFGACARRRKLRRGHK
ncbi:MAG: PEP-CTERM sorting domain-containing protein [Phycisphaerae bacterium]|nr:PEP-CTERM sorting domain-containing protein [Phycisphaerae bacterium]